MLNKSKVIEIIGVYARAWETQDKNLILTVFNNDAVYHERAFEEPFRGHEGIKAYWQNKVVESQKDISFKLLNVYLDGETAVAEWEAKFEDTKRGLHKQMIEVAILEFKNGRIQSLREYWTSRSV